MAASDADIRRQLETGSTLFSSGWRCVDSLEDVDGDYESEEEEEYVVMDLGTAMDARTLQTEAQYQLIGMDTPMPFLKIGEHVFQGAVAPLIGDEVIFDVVRQEDDPQRPHYRPAHKTSHRVELHAVGMTKRDPHAAPKPTPRDTVFDAPIGLTREMVNGEGFLEEPVAGPSRPRVIVARVNAGQPIPDDPPRQARRRMSASRSAPPSSPTKGGTSAAEDGGGASPKKKVGRPKGSMSRTTLPIRTPGDLTDINHAGGLGEVRLEIAPDATPELLQLVARVRGGKAAEPGVKLSRAQEGRLVRGLPATGPGSRGGRGIRSGGFKKTGDAARGGGGGGGGRGRGVGEGATGRGRGRGQGRGRGRGGPFVPSSGMGLAEAFFGAEGEGEDRDGDVEMRDGDEEEEEEEDEEEDELDRESEEGDGDGGIGLEEEEDETPAPAPVIPVQRTVPSVDSDDELREIGEDEQHWVE